MIRMSAKLNCASKTESGVGDDRQVTVTFGADYADGRNKEWARFTPSANVSIVLKGELGDRYQIGKSYVMFIQEEDEQPQG